MCYLRFRCHAELVPGLQFLGDEVQLQLLCILRQVVLYLLVNM
jgi:hypothetical protein